WRLPSVVRPELPIFLTRLHWPPRSNHKQIPRPQRNPANQHQSSRKRVRHLTRLKNRLPMSPPRQTITFRLTKSRFIFNAAGWSPMGQDGLSWTHQTRRTVTRLLKKVYIKPKLQSIPGFSSLDSPNTNSSKEPEPEVSTQPASLS
ncbi:hypothetical protein EX30DRAFT_375918, partial [Ascodesmis nigricans]